MFARAGLSGSATNVRNTSVNSNKKARPKSDTTATTSRTTRTKKQQQQGKPVEKQSDEVEDECSVTPAQILENAQEKDCNKVFEINFHAQKLKKIPNLKQFTKVRILDLSCNAIPNITGLETSSELKELKLYSNKIEEITGMERLKELQVLLLQHNRIKTIGKGLQSVRKLKILRLDSNLLSSIDHREIGCCGQLAVLDISNNRLTDISAINSLTTLEELDAAANQLTKIPVVSRCRHLQELDLSRNQIHDLSGLQGLVNLNILHLENNQVTSFNSVGKLRNLQELYVSHNRVSSLKDINQQFPSLEVLNVCHNLIASLDDFSPLTESSLIELSVLGNPCIRIEDAGYHQQLHKMIPSLEMIDGISLKRPPSSCGKAKPLMRPLSASQVLSSRQVEEQLKAAIFEQTSFEESIAKRYSSMKDLIDSLPAQLPKTLTLFDQEPAFDQDVESISSPERPDTAGESRPVSRCSNRSRIAQAKAFALEHFNSS
ncbi:protein phosphatase 1 regulatory subunit 7-like [Actinia tenebrosa]|uniref:Protein phosphatase 1 regulatory subunit 7-like n=1 Tax=Actinia tenebrosa TaxID=6105 RepID=A0A6P8ICC2_ACTTE|nr:protein phosphatase 1 regulatory subunit 7-like [Actinia tenebrosa]